MSEIARSANPRLSHTFALTLIVLVTVPLILLYLGTGSPNDMMEIFNLVPVREAFRDHNWLMPTLNGAPRFEKPPLAVWIPAGLATLLGNDSLWITRLPSVLLALMTGFSTYGIGCRLFRNDADPGRHRFYALLAALFLPAIHIFNHEARLAGHTTVPVTCPSLTAN